jgi:hypothetical protein
MARYPAVFIRYLSFLPIVQLTIQAINLHCLPVFWLNQRENVCLMNRVHQPLHDLRQLEPVRRLNVEREHRSLQFKPANLKLIAPIRFAEGAVEVAGLRPA